MHKTVLMKPRMMNLYALNKRNGAEKSTSRLIHNYTIVQPWLSRVLLNRKLNERV